MGPKQTRSLRDKVNVRVMVKKGWLTTGCNLIQDIFWGVLSFYKRYRRLISCPTVRVRSNYVWLKDLNNQVWPKCFRLNPNKFILPWQNLKWIVSHVFCNWLSLAIKNQCWAWYSEFPEFLWVLSQYPISC